MIRIFLKTLWNNRTRNILVFLELFIISVVLVNLTIYLADIVDVIRIKNCYHPENVVGMSIESIGKEKDTTGIALNNLKLLVQSLESVESVTFTSNATPYNYSLSTSGFKIGEEEVDIAYRMVDMDYQKVMQIKPIKGRWFDESDYGKAVKPVLISKDIDKKYFGGESIGKRFDEDEYEIIGVVDHFKRSDVERPYSYAFEMTNDVKEVTFWLTMLVRVKPGRVTDFMSHIENEVYTVLDPNHWVVARLNSLENARKKQNYESAQQRYLGLIIALFIMINVFLGVIGILWYNTNLRIHEIGIKRAIGAPKIRITQQLLLENFCMAIIGLLIVILVYLQVPSIRIVKVEPELLWISLGITTGVMLLLVMLSTWLPASIASRIHPAYALKTE